MTQPKPLPRLTPGPTPTPTPRPAYPVTPPPITPKKIIGYDSSGKAIWASTSAPATFPFTEPGVSQPTGTTTRYGPGDIPIPNINDPAYDLLDEYGKVIGRDYSSYYKDVAAYRNLTEGDSGDGGASSAAAAASAANQRMSNYLSAVIEGLGTEDEARRLRSDQAMQEFNRQLDAISEAGERFEGIQQFTIPEGSKYSTGFEPGGLATSLGLQPRESKPIAYDPFAIALNLIQTTPSPYAVGVPDTSQIQQAIDLAKRFL